MSKKLLSTVSLLFLWTDSLVVCRSQVNPAATVAEGKPSAKLTTPKEENLALDFVLNNLRNDASLHPSLTLRLAPISRLREEKLLFDGKAWPTYQPNHPLIVIGDLSLVAKRWEKNTQDMDYAFKIITGASRWQRAFRELYPECGMWISFCDVKHTNDTFRIHLSFGPSPHGAGADYLVKAEGKTWKIVKRDIKFNA